MYNLHRFLTLLILTPLVLNLDRCTPRQERAIEELNQRGVTILYSLTHQCGIIIRRGNPTGPPSTDIGQSAGPFAVYTINSIDNQRPAAVAFDFEANQLFLSTSRESRAVLASGSAATGGVRVAPGTIWTTGGLVIMKLEPPSSPYPSATSGLEYQRLPGNPPVLMLARPSGTGVVRRDSCLLSTLPALPDFR